MEIGLRKRVVQSIFVTAVAIVAGGVGYWSGATAWLDRAIYDVVARTPAAAPMTELALVTPGSATALMSTEDHAKLIDRIAAAGAKTIVYTLPLPPSAANNSATDPLAASLQRAGNVLLAASATQSAEAWPAWMERFTHPVPSGLSAHSTHLSAIAQPYATQAAGAGHGLVLEDADGMVRGHPLVVEAHGRAPAQALPSLALLATLHSLHRNLDDWQPTAKAQTLHWPGTRTVTGQDMQLRPRMDEASRSAWPTLAATDVMRGTAAASSLAHKVVLVGTAGKDANSPSSIQVLAHAITSLRQGHGLHPAPWASAGLAAVLLLGLGYLAGVAPRVQRRGASYAALAGVGLVVALVGAQWTLLASANQWLPGLMAVALGLAAGQLAWLFVGAFASSTTRNTKKPFRHAMQNVTSTARRTSSNQRATHARTVSDRKESDVAYRRTRRAVVYDALRVPSKDDNAI